MKIAEGHLSCFYSTILGLRSTFRLLILNGNNPWLMQVFPMHTPALRTLCAAFDMESEDKKACHTEYVRASTKLSWSTLVWLLVFWKIAATGKDNSRWSILQQIEPGELGIATVFCKDSSEGGPAPQCCVHIMYCIVSSYNRYCKNAPKACSTLILVQWYMGNPNKIDFLFSSSKRHRFEVRSLVIYSRVYNPFRESLDEQDQNDLHCRQSAIRWTFV